MTELAGTASASTAGFDAGAAGITPPSDRARHGVFLGEIVVELGFADRATMDAAEQGARQGATTLEQFLLDHNILDEEQLARAIAERHDVDHVDLDRFEVDAEAVQLLGRAAALRYMAAPIAFAPDGALVVAVKDPLDFLGVNDIEVMTRAEVRRVVATPSGILRLIERMDAEPPPPDPNLDGFAGLAEQQPEEKEEPRPEGPSPAPPPDSEQPPSAAPDAEAAADGEPGELSTELRALSEAARKADSLALSLGRRIEALERAEQRAQRLEQELAATRERAEAVEGQLGSVVSAAEGAVEATEKLTALRRVLEEAAG